jgi:hypothetical protein
MGRERERERKPHKDETEEPVIVDDIIREDCPCPKTDCERHKHCGPCRYRHRKGTPYCERGKKE